MWNRKRRQALLRARRERQALAGPVAHWPAEDEIRFVRRRPRHRAPTPRLRIPWRSLVSSPARVAVTVALTTLSLLLAHVASSDTYRVLGAAVSGNTRVSAETIYAASGLDGRISLWADTSAARAGVEALPDIKSAAVRVAWPARVWIRVDETSPVLRWIGPAGELIVDERGRAISAGSAPLDLVEVHDESGLLHAVGGTIPTQLVEAARAFGKLFGPLRYRADVGFVATTPEGWTVRLGADASMAARHAAVLAALREQLASYSQAVALVDLRFAERPYFRLHGEGE